MSPQYAIALFAFAATLLGCVALVWALWRRQLKTGDVEMYAAVADEEPDYADTPRALPSGRSASWLLGTALAAILALVVWMQVLTLRAAGHVGVASRASSAPVPRTGD